MHTAKVFIYVLACLSLCVGTLFVGPLFSEPAAAANVTSENHVVVLQYHPGEPNILIRSIDGIQTAQMLAVPRPLLHSAAYYSGFVLLAALATYFKNAELLSVISLAGIPILAVVTIRDLSQLLQGGP